MTNAASLAQDRDAWRAMVRRVTAARTRVIRRKKNEQNYIERLSEAVTSDDTDVLIKSLPKRSQNMNINLPSSEDPSPNATPSNYDDPREIIRNRQRAEPYPLGRSRVGSNTSMRRTGSRRPNELSQRRTDSASASVTDVEYDGFLCCNPYKWFMRYTALAMMCILGFGSFFCYDNPGALQSQMKQDMGITTAQFASLYSWYSWPNIILCFVGGYLMDKVFGVRLGAFLFSFLVFLGQLIFAAGGIFDSFPLMCVGRFVFGLGGECLQVAQNSYAVLWFRDKELNFVFGLQLSIARLGSTVNFLIVGPIYDWVHDHEGHRGPSATGYTLLLASVTAFISFVAGSILGLMDRHREKVYKRYLDPSVAGEKTTIHISDVKSFGATFWFITGICVTFYIAIMPFIGLGQQFFVHKFNLDKTDANTVNGLLYLISAASSPIFGYLVDLTGRNVLWTLAAAVSTLVCHALLAFTFLNPYYAMVSMGLSYSMMASSLWPMVALNLHTSHLGTAYGIIQAAQNLGVGVATIVCGIIVDRMGYLILEVFFLIFLAVSVIFAVLLWMFDAKVGGMLNMSIKQRSEEEARQKAAAEQMREEEELESRTPRDLLMPRSNFHLRNRYLAKLGAQLPSHYDVRVQSFVYKQTFR